ncbi:MAG: putative Fe-S cluster assembly protein SufT [Spongiibacteraceae bacterium]|jgi:probable FeS assembly SUF system protein SufT|nr:putative Fe-S cluster assembly protein SufT [Spongiibacteraceae bacterium]
MQQTMTTTLRDCPARTVPAGQHTTIPQGEFLTINQTLGGNYTVTWRGNMYRIDGSDADAIDRERAVYEFADDGSGQVDEDQVWQALDTIYDPEIPISLVQLGLIYQVEVDADSGRVDIRMTLTAPGCGMGPVLVSDVEYRVSKVPNVTSVHVDLVFDPPWSREMMSEEAQLEAGLFF